MQNMILIFSQSLNPRDSHQRRQCPLSSSHELAGHTRRVALADSLHCAALDQPLGKPGSTLSLGTKSQHKRQICRRGVDRLVDLNDSTARKQGVRTGQTLVS